MWRSVSVVLPRRYNKPTSTNNRPIWLTNTRYWVILCFMLVIIYAQAIRLQNSSSNTGALVKHLMDNVYVVYWEQLQIFIYCFLVRVTSNVKFHCTVLNLQSSFKKSVAFEVYLKAASSTAAIPSPPVPTSRCWISSASPEDRNLRTSFSGELWDGFTGRQVGAAWAFSTVQTNVFPPAD